MKNTFASLNTIYIRIFCQLNRRQENISIIIGIFLVISALLESVCVYLMSPFIGSSVSLTSDTSISTTDSQISFLSNLSLYQFALLYVCIIVLSLLFKLISQAINVYYIADLAGSLSIKSYESKITNHDPNQALPGLSETTNLLTIKSEQTFQFLGATIEILANSIRFCLLLTVLLLANGRITMIIIIGYTTIYMLSILVSKSRLVAISTSVTRSKTQLIENIRCVVNNYYHNYLVGGLPFSSQEYSSIISRVFSLNAKSKFIGQYMKPLMDSITLSLIVFSVVYISSTVSDPAQTLPLVALYAVASQKLLPSFQATYKGWARLVTLSSPVNDFISTTLGSHSDSRHLLSPILLHESESYACIQIKNASLKRSENYVFKDVSIAVPASTHVVISGASGSGKSTFLRAIAGINQLSSGQITIRLRHKSNKLQDNDHYVGYVSRDSCLVNGTFAQNIAYPNDPHTFTNREFSRAIYASCCDDFVADFPLKLDHLLDSTSNNLSDGQIQRVLIARALIRSPKLLLLDESTSALDSTLESKLLDRLLSLRDVIIISVAHRAGVIAKADYHYILSDQSLTLSPFANHSSSGLS